MNKATNQLKRLTVEVRKGMIDRIKFIAIYKDKTMSQIVRNALHMYIRSYERSQIKKIT